MKYLLKGWTNEEYQDYFFIITDVSNNGGIVDYNTRVEKLDNIGLENEIVYNVTSPTYEDGVKGMIAFCNHQNIKFPEIVIEHVLTNPYVAGAFEGYAS